MLKGIIICGGDVNVYECMCHFEPHAQREVVKASGVDDTLQQRREEEGHATAAAGTCAYAFMHVRFVLSVK